MTHTELNPPTFYAVKDLDDFGKDMEFLEVSWKQQKEWEKIGHWWGAAAEMHSYKTEAEKMLFQKGSDSDSQWLGLGSVEEIWADTGR